MGFDTDDEKQSSYSTSVHNADRVPEPNEGVSRSSSDVSLQKISVQAIRTTKAVVLLNRRLFEIMAWMYILCCNDGSYYVGSTKDLERRLEEHNADAGMGTKYTARRRPVRLVYAEEFDSIRTAFEREKQVQGWGRAKREALIRGDFKVLPGLAKKKFKKRD